MRCECCPYHEPDYWWCDKVGGKNILFGYCSEVYEIDAKQNRQYSKKKRTTKYERNQKYQNYLKQLSKKTSSYFPSVVYIDGLHYYKRYYRGRRSKYLKKIFNRKIRRHKCELPKQGLRFHKIYDFWYELY